MQLISSNYRFNSVTSSERRRCTRDSPCTIVFVIELVLLACSHVCSLVSTYAFYFHKQAPLIFVRFKPMFKRMYGENSLKINNIFTTTYTRTRHGEAIVFFIPNTLNGTMQFCLLLFSCLLCWIHPFWRSGFWNFMLIYLPHQIHCNESSRPFDTSSSHTVQHKVFLSELSANGVKHENCLLQRNISSTFFQSYNLSTRYYSLLCQATHSPTIHYFQEFIRNTP